MLFYPGLQRMFLSLQVTLADIKAYPVIEAMIPFKPGEGLDQTPLLKAYYERIAALSNITT